MNLPSATESAATRRIQGAHGSRAKLMQTSGASSGAYAFTPDDNMFPVYCTGCRAHIPKLISTANNGPCPTCLQNQQAAARAAAQAQGAAQQQAQATQDAQAAAVYNVDTGMGACPQCTSRNIVQFEDTVPNTGEKNGVALAALACFIIGLLTVCFWIGIPLIILSVILLIIGLCMPGTKKIGTSRQCRYCGFRWHV